MAQTKGPKPAPKPVAQPPTFAKLYWLRIALGLVSGGLAYWSFSTTPINVNNTLNGVLSAIIVYLATYYLARYVWYRKLDQEYVSKLYTTGIGGFIMLFVFSWILLFTLFSALA